MARKLEAAKRALATKPDREQAQELVDLLPQLDVDDTLLAEESFREMLAALDFRATFEPTRNELRIRATLVPELLPVNGDGMSSPLSVPDQCPLTELRRDAVEGLRQPLDDGRVVRGHDVRCASGGSRRRPR
jgi:hypothetical protein